MEEGRPAAFRTRRSGHSALLAIPFLLIVAIAVTDVLVPQDVHFGPLLVIAPALTAALAGPRLTALAGVAAVAAQVFIAFFYDVGLNTSIVAAQICAIAVLSALVVGVCVARDRRDRALSRARSVAETAQRVLLRPPPRQVGPQRLAWLYMTAQDETQIGGDLFSVTRAAHPATRVIIGDVRGHGLESIGEASMVLGAFREGAFRHRRLPELAAELEHSVIRDQEESADPDRDPGEHFITALLLDLPDDSDRAEMLNCGHPPPLLIHDGEVTVLDARRPSPPLGVWSLEPYEAAYRPRTDSFRFEPGDKLVLYTDGVIEARSPAGEFYPFIERVAAHRAADPEALLRYIRGDLLDHTAGHTSDDAALLVLERVPSRPPGEDAGRVSEGAGPAGDGATRAGQGVRAEGDT